MVYLPEQHVSIVVMINAYPNEGAEAITTGLTKVVLKDLDAYGIFQIIQANLKYFIIAIFGIASWTVAMIIILRKKRKKQPDPNNDQMP